MSGKKSAVARARVKNGRRLKRHGFKSWMHRQPMPIYGNGGTDKSGTKHKPVYYSDAPADR